MSEKPFGVRYLSTNRRGEFVVKEKWFVTSEAREQGIEKLAETSSFVRVESFCDEVRT